MPSPFPGMNPYLEANEYDRGGYDYVVDYQQPPPPPLSETEQKQVEQIRVGIISKDRSENEADDTA